MGTQVFDEEGEEGAEDVAQDDKEDEDEDEDEERALADAGAVVYDDEEVTVGEEYDFVTLKETATRLFVRDRRLPAHASDPVGIMVLAPRPRPRPAPAAVSPVLVRSSPPFTLYFLIP